MTEETGHRPKEHPPPNNILELPGLHTARVATEDAKGARLLFKEGYVEMAMSELCFSFHALRHLNPPGAHPWKPLALRAWLQGKGRVCSPSERRCAHFVLSVWNPSEATNILGPFDMFEALASWDDSHRAVLVEWARNPWWP